MPTVGKLSSCYICSRVFFRLADSPTAAAFNPISSYKKGSGLDLRVDTSQNNMQTFTGNGLNGGSTIPTSPVPYIKNEPLGTPPEHRRFSQHGFPDAYVMNGNGAYHQHASPFGQNYDSIDPATLTMSPNPHDQPRNVIQQNGGFPQSYGPNFNGTAAYMTTAELIALDLRKNDGMDGLGHGDDSLSEYLISSPGVVLTNGAFDSSYSQTPDNSQCDSPFARPYHQFRSMQAFNGGGVESPSSYNSQMSR